MDTGINPAGHYRPPSPQQALQSNRQPEATAPKENAPEPDAATKKTGVQQGLQWVQVAHHALSEVSVHLSQIRALSVQAFNRGGSQTLQASVEAHLQQISAHAKAARFNNVPLLDGSNYSFAFAVDENHTQKIDIEVNVLRKPVEHSYTGGTDISNGVHLGKHLFVLTVGHQTLVLTGDFSSGEDFVKAINDAHIGGLTASLDRGALKLHAYRPVRISGQGSRDLNIQNAHPIGTPTEAPLFHPLVKTTIDAKISIQDVDTMQAWIHAEQDHLHTAENQLLEAARSQGITTGLSETA